MKRLFAGLLLLSVLLGACSTPGSAMLVEVTATPTEPVPTETHVPVDLPPAARAAMEALAAALGLSIDEISLVSVEAVDWPDHCLGVVHMGVMCAQGVVPGFRVLLAANDTQYEYHTNADGTTVSPAAGVPAEAAPEILEAARQALAKALGVGVSAVTVVSVTATEWPDSCLGLSLPGVGCAEVITPGYLIVLEANGRTHEYHSNFDGSVVRPGSLLLTWERNGGIAGFCDSLVLFGSGEAEGMSCQQNGANQAATLTADERAQLEAWVAEYGSVVIEQADAPLAADGMQAKLVLYGTGTEQPDAAAQDAMVAWAQAIYTRLGQ
jgi:hypothetical protein